MSIHIPYTYLIGWTSTDKYYYGVRFAKNCNPSELFIKYFTSSKHVKDYIKKHGKPDIIQIRKTFKEVKDAIQWENKVLRRMNLKENTKFLNATNNEAIPYVKFDRAKNFENWLKLPYEQRLSEEVRKRKAEKCRENALKLHKSGKMTYAKPEDTTNYKIAAKRRWSNLEFKRKAKSRKHINNGKISKTILPEQLDLFLNLGWVLGRLPR